MKINITEEEYRNLALIVQDIMLDALENYHPDNIEVPINALSAFDGAFTCWVEEIIDTIGADK